MFRHDLEAVDQPDHGLRRAEHQIAVARRGAGHAVEHVDLGLLVEIDQHVAAEDHVEQAELGKVAEQVELAVFDHGAQLRRDLPQLADLGEMADQKLNRQPALHLELAVDPKPCLLQHLAGEIGRQNVDAPAGDLALHGFEAHGERIRLLPGGRGGAPDADRARRATRRDQRRHDDVAEMLERHLVAEEERLVGHHRFDDRGHQRIVLAEAEHAHQIAEAAQASLARDRQ